MSIVVNGLSYRHPDREELFSGISFSVTANNSTSLIGNNGTGKSTVLKIIAGQLRQYEGNISVEGTVYYIPQHFGQFNNMTVAETMGIDKKVCALNNILGGNGTDEDYEILNDEWNEERSRTSLNSLGLEHISLQDSLNNLSGGKKTKVFLAGIEIYHPDNILMDEPTNHLDRTSRERLYKFIVETKKTILLVSHDRELLNLMDATLELTSNGVHRYGGNYDLYKEIKDTETEALIESIGEKEKKLRLARRTASEVMDRKQKQDLRGEKQKKREGVPRIMMKTLKDNAEKSYNNLADKHAEKIENTAAEIRKLRAKLAPGHDMKVKIEQSELHKGKVLFSAEDINFSYSGDNYLWKHPLSVKIFSGDRIQLCGDNGSGKTTLLKIIMNYLQPSCGIVQRTEFSHIYLDQEYSLIDPVLTVIEQVDKFNTTNIHDHIIKTELHRYLFPKESWEKKCSALSGGEKLRLTLCCMAVKDSTPDVFILDEPTNNLDIRSMEILTNSIKEYKGTILLISHDLNFAKEIGTNQIIVIE